MSRHSLCHRLLLPLTLLANRRQGLYAEMKWATPGGGPPQAAKVEFLYPRQDTIQVARIRPPGNHRPERRLGAVPSRFANRHTRAGLARHEVRLFGHWTAFPNAGIRIRKPGPRSRTALPRPKMALTSADTRAATRTVTTGRRLSSVRRQPSGCHTCRAHRSDGPSASPLDTRGPSCKSRRRR